jgi:hypothetical protein
MAFDLLAFGQVFQSTGFNIAESGECAKDDGGGKDEEERTESYARIYFFRIGFAHESDVLLISTVSKCVSSVFQLVPQNIDSERQANTEKCDRALVERHYNENEGALRIEMHDESLDENEYASQGHDKGRQEKDHSADGSVPAVSNGTLDCDERERRPCVKDERQGPPQDPAGMAVGQHEVSVGRKAGKENKTGGERDGMTHGWFHRFSARPASNDVFTRFMSAFDTTVTNDPASFILGE